MDEICTVLKLSNPRVILLLSIHGKLIQLVAICELFINFTMLVKYLKKGIFNLEINLNCRLAIEKLKFVNITGYYGLRFINISFN